MRYVFAVLGITMVTAGLAPFHNHVNSTTVALALLLVILFVATLWGSRPALLASVAGMLCFNFFFLPPLYTFTVSDPQNWVALTAFFVTAITCGQLSARARKRAEEAESGRKEIERLYRKLQDAFKRASHAEALRESEKLKAALLDAVTHDLRTPLASIKASITTLLDDSLRTGAENHPTSLSAEDRGEMMEVINQESDRLNRFIGSLIELARIEAGELHLRRRWGSMDEIITTALTRADALTSGRQIHIAIDDEMPLARLDPNAVSEVVYTVLDNAAKYSPAGTSILVAARRAAEEELEISVEDEGPGIPPELRDRVFDKFFRISEDGDHPHGDQPRGTGMGLAIARGIIEAHGGRIWVEGGATGGARVVFTLPIGDDEEVQPGEPSITYQQPAERQPALKGLPEVS